MQKSNGKIFAAECDLLYPVKAMNVPKDKIFINPLILYGLFYKLDQKRWGAAESTCANFGIFSKKIKYNHFKLIEIIISVIIGINYAV